MAATVAHPTMDKNRMPPTHIDHQNTVYTGPGSTYNSHSVQYRTENVRNVFIYRNGDVHYKAKKFVINPKKVHDMDNFMIAVSDIYKPRQNYIYY